MTAGRDGRGQSSAINPPGMIPPSHHENDEPVSLGAEPGSPVTESFGPELNSPAGDYRHGADEGEAEASGIEEEKDEGKPPSGIGALGVTYAVSGGGTECRICLMDDGAMCSPCDCSGSTQFVHLDCLARWCRETGAVTCELCNGALPSHFIDAGKTVRRARAAQEAERREAAERLERLTSNFELAYGRPPRGSMDYAIINLNSVLEAEAAQRRRMHERGVPPDAPEARGGVQVVMIDAQGRAQVLNTRDMGPRGFVDELMEREAARYQLDRGMVIGPDGHLRYEEDLRLTSDIERVHANAQFRFWLRVILTLLSCFLILYVVVAIIAASDSSSSESLPVFLFRLFGFTLPLVLIARAAYVYRRRREEATMHRMNEIFVVHDGEASRRRRDERERRQRERNLFDVFQVEERTQPQHQPPPRVGP